MRLLCILLCLFPYVIPQCNNCVLVVTCYDGSFDSPSSTFYDGILTTTISTDANGCEVITNITCSEEPGYVPTNPEQYQYLYNQDYGFIDQGNLPMTCANGSWAGSVTFTCIVYRATGDPTPPPPDPTCKATTTTSTTSTTSTTTTTPTTTSTTTTPTTTTTSTTSTTTTTTPTTTTTSTSTTTTPTTTSTTTTPTTTTTTTPTTTTTTTPTTTTSTSTTTTPTTTSTTTTPTTTTTTTPTTTTTTTPTTTTTSTTTTTTPTTTSTTTTPTTTTTTTPTTTTTTTPTTTTTTTPTTTTSTTTTTTPTTTTTTTPTTTTTTTPTTTTTTTPTTTTTSTSTTTTPTTTSTTTTPTTTTTITPTTTTTTTPTTTTTSTTTTTTPTTTSTTTTPTTTTTTTPTTTSTSTTTTPTTTTTTTPTTTTTSTSTSTTTTPTTTSTSALTTTTTSGACCGQWSSWTVTQACTDTCGGCGTWTKTRTCPSNSTCSCAGNSTLTEPCNMVPCSYPRTSCCSGLSAQAVNGQILCASSTASPTAATPCPNSTCCPTGGMWSEWQSTSCNDTCGAFGVGTYTRTCLTAPDCNCTGSSSMTDRCNLSPCPYPRSSCATGYSAKSVNAQIVCANSTTVPTPPPASCCPDGGLWSPWGSWSTCNNSCGACALTTRTRTCGSAAYGCPCASAAVTTSETLPCNRAPCTYPNSSCCSPYVATYISGQVLCWNASVTTLAPTTTTTTAAPGVWSAWSNSGCSDTCGMCGFVTQTRSCLGPGSCIGSSSQNSTTKCTSTVCPFPKPTCCTGYTRTAVNGTFQCAATG